MWKTRPDRHCSDDLLLAHLDGELKGLTRLRTAAHLRRCWECRAHLSELENQAEALARMWAAQAPADSSGAAGAKAAFLAWKTGFEKDLARSRPKRTPVLPWSLAAAAACAITALFLLPGPEAKQGGVPAPAEVLSGIRSFHAGLDRQPGAVHQVFRVDVIQTRPVARRSTGRLEVWSDPGSGRRASRWLDERNALKYAVWTRHGQAPFVYAAAGGPLAEDAGSLLEPDAAGLEVEQLERAFFAWLRKHDWRLAAGVSEAIGGDGARLSVERLGKGALRVRASRPGKTVRADFSIDVDGGSFRPRLQVMRFETDERTLEIRVTADRLEVVPSTRVNAAVFEPDVRRISLPPRIPAPGVDPVTAVVPAAKSAEEIETEVLWALHRARACVSESVEFSTGPGGKVAVKAMVRSDRRRSELAEILQQAAEGRVEFDIQVVERSRRGPVRSHPLLPAEGVRAIDALYTEALALTRLAERYGQEKAAKLTPRQRQVVDRMVRDHVASLGSATRLARGEVEPALAAVAGPLQARAPDPPQPAGWTEAVFGFFRALNRADDLIDSPGRTDDAEAQRQESAAALLGVMAELEWRVRQLDGMVVHRVAESTIGPH